MSAEPRSFASVSRIQARIRKLLDPALSAKPFWVKAELSSVSIRNGSMYCDLVEIEGGRVKAKLRCTVWRSNLARMKRRLEEASLGSELLEDGNEVGLCVAIEYHELYGLSVTATDIDPSVLLGELERRRQEIIATLTREGLIDKNAEHEVPLLPMRIGLVASKGTAGYKDFVTTIERSGYAIQISAADARVQGDDTERSVLRALQCLSQLELDLVVVLRGGGSRSDLSYLDNEAIARAIATYELPVWTGIGHEIDTSVLDVVANQSFKTPTAIAEAIVARYVEAEERLREAAGRLRAAAQLRLQPERERLEMADQRLESMVRRSLRERRQARESDAMSFRLLVDRRLASEDAKLAQSRSRLRVLARERSHVAMRALDEHRKSLHKTTGRAIERHRERLQMRRERLSSPTATNRLGSERRRLDAWRQVLRLADPARVLERGFALVYDPSGALLRSASQLSKGQTVVAQLADGRVEAKVESITQEPARKATD